MDTLAVMIFLALIVAVLIISTIYFFAHMRADYNIRLNNHREDLEDRAARRHLLLTRLNPDPNGNYPVYFNEQLEYISPPGGNSPYPNQVYFQPGAGAGQSPKISVIKPPTPSQVRINAYNAQKVIGEVGTPELLPEGLSFQAEKSENSFEPEKPTEKLSDLEIRDFLWQAKREGENKTKSLSKNGGGVFTNSLNWEA